MAVIHRIYSEKLGASSVTTFVGNFGEIFYDPGSLTLRISDGVTAGGRLMIGGGSGSSTASDVTYTPGANTSIPSATNLQGAIDALDAAKLSLSGGTMSGELFLDGTAPTDANSAVPNWYMQQYVSDFVANGNITSNTIVFDNTGTTLVANNLQAAIAELDANKLDLTGGDMTGPITTNQTVFATNELVSRAFVETYLTSSDTYIDAAAFNASTGVINLVDTAGSVLSINIDGRYLPLSGGTLTGPLILDGSVSADGNAAVTQTFMETYVSNTIINGGVTSNTVVFNNANTTLTANTVQEAIAELDANKVDKAGDVMTGFLELHADPTANLHAATKQYVDSTVANTIANGGVTSNTIVFDSSNTTLTANTVQEAIETLSANVDTLEATVANLHINDLLDVNTAPVSGDILTWNGAEWINTPFETISANSSNILDHADVVGTTLAADQFLVYDGANWTNSTAPVSQLSDVDATGVTNGQVLAWNGTNFVPFSIPPGTTDTFTSMGVIDANTGMITFTKNDSGTYQVDISSYVSNAMPTTIDDLSDANTAGALATQALVYDGAEWKPKSLQLNDLTDASTAGAANGQVLTFNGTVFAPLALPADTRLLAASFNTTDGDFQLNMSTGTTLTVNLDGRYVEKVNGISPNANGEVSVSFTATETGTLAGRPATANDGLIYVVSGDANTSLNGDAYIWSGNTASGVWVEIAPGDQATNDARYVLGGGDTMTGPLILATDPTSALGATTKQYVDGLVQTSSIYANTVQFDVTTGQFDVILSNNHSFGTSIDGRYVNLSGGTMTGALTLSADPTNALEAATKQYVDAQIVASSTDSFVSFGVANSTTLTLTRNDGNTVVVDMSALEDVRVASGVLAANTITLTMSDSTTVAIDVGDIDTRIAQAKLVTGSFNTSTGQLSGTYGNGGSFVIADLDGRYVQSVNGIQADSNGNVAVSLTETNVGTLAGRPATANAGVVYIVAADPDANNDGRTFIYDVDTTAWYEVATADTAANDARYVNLAGDTMTGPLVLAADPTADLEATTKQYVDDNLFNVTLATSSPTSNNNAGDLFFDTTVGSELLYIWDGTQWFSTAPSTGSSAGDVVGPASATDNAIARFDTTTGKLIQNSSATISDVGYLTAAGFVGTEFIRNSGYYIQDIVSQTTATIDVRSKAYQKLTISSAQSVNFMNTSITAGVALSFTLEIVMGAFGSLTWPANVKWAGGTPPTLTPGKTHIVMLSTSDSATNWLASAITDFA